MAFNSRSTSILPRIGCGDEINDYAAINHPSQSDILSSYLPDRNPHSSHFSFSTNVLENDITVQPSGKERSNTPNSQVNPYESSNKRILIVDDDVDIARFFKLALERAGFITEVSSNPLSALANYKKGAYDLLLLDINMPQMTGFELYKKISKIESEVKVCFITAFEEYYSEFRKEFPNLNELKCYIKKPVGMDYLINAVKSRLDSD